MPRQGELLDKPKISRRVIAHAIDAGHYPDGSQAAQFACRRCAWVQWMRVKNVSEAKRGYPCPNCNK